MSFYQEFVYKRKNFGDMVFKTASPRFIVVCQAGGVNLNEYFKVLYTAHFRKVYIICYMILGNHELVEEVAQDTFIAAYENIATLKDPAKFPAWIKTIARNKAISLYNRNKKIVPIKDEWLVDYFEQNNCNQNDVSDVLVKDELEGILGKAINDLPGELRGLVILK